LVDYVPLFPRYELEDGQWILRTWPPNMASARDIPTNALLHASLRERIKGIESKRPYVPRNNHGNGDPCLKLDNFLEIDGEGATEIDIDDEAADEYEQVDHKLYALHKSVVTNHKAEAARIADLRKEQYRLAHIRAGPDASISNGLKAPAFCVIGQKNPI
jgi:hypothetical protein